MSWYKPINIAEIDSPALLVYPERIEHNIDYMIEQVDQNPDRLAPHVKTHKMLEVVKMQLAKGISRFKCATISELEMTLESGAPFVLMAYQLTGPKLDRYVKLVQKFPNARVASLVDNFHSAEIINQVFSSLKRKANIYLDINNGMDRTGHLIDHNTQHLYHAISQLDNLYLCGLHVYDGHIRDKSFAERKEQSNADFHSILKVKKKIEDLGLDEPDIIVGGSPTFKPAALREKFICSPGTTLLWDWGYSSTISELDILCAAVVITRVISKPVRRIITLDLGHKSVGAENPLNMRIKFLNLKGYEVISQSEEHLVLHLANTDNIAIGDVFYGIPFHICPTVALYNQAQIVANGKVIDKWNIRRGRVLSI